MIPGSRYFLDKQFWLLITTVVLALAFLVAVDQLGKRTPNVLLGHDGGIATKVSAEGVVTQQRNDIAGGTVLVKSQMGADGPVTTAWLQFGYMSEQVQCVVPTPPYVEAYLRQKK